MNQASQNPADERIPIKTGLRLAAAYLILNATALSVFYYQAMISYFEVTLDEDSLRYLWLVAWLAVPISTLYVLNRLAVYRHRLIGMALTVIVGLHLVALWVVPMIYMTTGPKQWFMTHAILEGICERFCPADIWQGYVLHTPHGQLQCPSAPDTGTI